MCSCNWNYWNVQDRTGSVCEYTKVPYKAGQVDAGWLEGAGRRIRKKKTEGGIQAATCIYYMWTLAIHQLTQMHRGDYFPNYNLR